MPQLGSQIYAMAGMVNRVNLMADRSGTFRGLSAHYSGEGFANMGFAVDAVPAAQFAGWVAGAKAAGPVLDGAGYRALGDVAGNVAPFTYRAVAPRFFRGRGGGGDDPAQDRDRRAPAGRDGDKECSVGSAGKRSRSTSRCR